MKVPVTLLACLLGISGAATALAQDIQVEVNGPAGTLRGSMNGHVPDENRPVVLIVPGSGPTDQDGNNPLGVAAASYRLLAEGLAEQGVASVRIDKRGMFGSAVLGLDPNDVTIDDYAEDLDAWIERTIELTNEECVWILGHSEGGLVGLVAAQDAPNVCGLIELAAPGRSMGDTIRTQLSANPANAPLMDDALGALDALERGENVDPSGMHPALQQLFNPAVQGFLISALSYEPAELMATYQGPAIVIQGDADLQITVADAERLASARDGVSLVILPSVNHVLKTVPPDDRAANLAAYGDPNQPLAPGVVDAITAFIEEQG